MSYPLQSRAKKIQYNEYYDDEGGDYSEEEEHEHLSPYQIKHLDKSKFLVCDETGQCVKVVWNKFPAGAARKGASEGLTKIFVYNPEKDKWYAYAGKRLKIKAKDLSEHQREFGMKYNTKVYRMPW